MKARRIVSILCLLALAAVAGVPWFITRRTRRPKIDGWSHVMERLRAPDRAPDVEGPYEASYARLYKTRAGESSPLVLVDAPDRELALAESLLEQDFVREAAFHARNVATYHPSSPEADRARALLRSAMPRSVFLQLEGLDRFFIEDKRYFLPVPAERAGLSRDDLEELREGRESEVAVRHPGTAVAFALHYQLARTSNGETAAAHYRQALESVQIPALPLARPQTDRMYHNGVAGTQRLESEPREEVFERKGIPWDDNGLAPSEEPAIFFPGATWEGTGSPKYVCMPRGNRQPLPAGCLFYEAAFGGLYENERRYKRRFLEDAASALGETPEIERARIYFGIAADPRPVVKTGLDEIYEQRVRDNPYLKIEASSIVTPRSRLPLRVTSANIDRIRFRFARIEGALPGDEAALKKFLDEKRAAELPAAFEEDLAVADNLELPIREPGVFRVTAEAADLRAIFFATRTDARLETLIFPNETIFLARNGGSPLAGVTLSCGTQTLGLTDSDGALRLPGVFRFTPWTPPPGRKYCPEHESCCSSCSSCAHHHEIGALPTQNGVLTLFASAPGAFFRAGAKPDTAPLDKVPAFSQGPVLFVYTDRPVYRAGDPLRFRGILRTPRRTLARGDDARFDPSPNQEVLVTILRDQETVFTRNYVTGDFGTIFGEFQIPLSSHRSEYMLQVTCNGARAQSIFEVMDYRKSDFIVTLTPAAGGVLVKAGYAWGAPVSGAQTRAYVEGKEVALRDGIVPARGGESVRVVLMRGEEELASKTMMCKEEKKEKSEEQRTENKEQRAENTEPTKVGSAMKEDAPPAITANKARYERGDTIELEIVGPDGEALVALGDVQAYDWQRVTIRGGRGTARFPVRGVLDPGTTAFAVIGEKIERLPIRVSAQRMPVRIEFEKARAKPGEEVGVTVRAHPGSALSLAAVDEAIYMLREDDTPEMYGAFYVPRPAAMVHAAFGAPEFDGETREVEHAPRDPKIFARTRCDDAFLSPAYKSYDTIGVGGGAGSGGRWGGCFGGRSTTDSSVLTGLKHLLRGQQEDGAWKDERSGPCALGSVGNTGVVLMALLGAGFSPLSKDEYSDSGRTLRSGEAVKKGLRWLIDHQDAEGCIGSRSGEWLMEHAFATLALYQACNMPGSETLKPPARKALDFLLSRQAEDGGWHPSGGSSGEAPMSALVVMVLASAEALPNAPVLRFFDELMRQDGTCPESRAPGARVTTFSNACGLSALLYLKKDKNDPRLKACVDRLLLDRPDAGNPDPAAWHAVSVALFKYDGPDGPCWKKWNEAVKNAAIHAKSESVYQAAINTLTLEIYYRYANVFGTPGGSTRMSPIVAMPAVRLYFPDTILWVPELVTDAKGEARVRLKMPDSITTVRLTSRGVTRDGAIGEAVGRIESQLPFFVNLKTPEFFVVGDEPVIRAEVFNYTGTPANVAIKLSGDGFVPVDEPRRDLSVGIHPESVSWRVRVVDPAKVRFVVDAERDSVEKVVPVRAPTSPVTILKKGPRVELPKGAQALELVVRISPKNSPLAKILEALRYLNGYPHG